MIKDARISSLIFLLTVIAGALALQIDRDLKTQAMAMNLPDTLYRVVGTAKEAFGDMLFLKADSYYHGGVTTEFIETREDLQKEGLVHEEAHEAEEAPLDWIAKINSQIKRHGHYHLPKDEQKEMLPFFSLAVNLDPYNVEAILTAAYWIDSHFGKVGEAIRVLKEGSKNNPGSWEIDYSLARIYFKRRKDFAQSEFYYLEAIRKMDEKSGRGALRDCYYLLGESRLKQGKKKEALEAFQKALTFYAEGESDPLKSVISGRIKELA